MFRNDADTNSVYILYNARQTSANQRVRCYKGINGVSTELATTDVGLQSSIRFRIKRVSATNTFTFYYDIGSGWQQVWSGVIYDATYLNYSHQLRIIITGAIEATPDIWEPEVAWYRQNTDDGIPAQRFWDDSPECRVVDSAAGDWAFDAGAGLTWQLGGASCMKSEPGTSSVLFKLGYSDTGNDADVTWVDTTWQTIAQVDSSAANGDYDGHRYIHVKAQFNSDGTDQPTLTSFTVKGRKAP
jgi:hypothetical protein